MFVTQAEQADLKVEVVPRERVLDKKIGFFTTTEGRIGRIEIAAYGGRDKVREFYLRTTLIYEIGHALGLAHLSGQKCNFMSPENYTCFANKPQECRTDFHDTRCVAVQFDQIQSIEKLLLTETGKAPARELSR